MAGGMMNYTNLLRTLCDEMIRKFQELVERLESIVADVRAMMQRAHLEENVELRNESVIPELNSLVSALESTRKELESRAERDTTLMIVVRRQLNNVSAIEDRYTELNERVKDLLHDAESLIRRNNLQNEGIVSSETDESSSS